MIHESKWKEVEDELDHAKDIERAIVMDAPYNILELLITRDYSCHQYLLDVAIQYGRIDAVGLLEKHGTDVNLWGFFSFEFLDWWIEQEGANIGVTLVKMMRANGADPAHKLYLLGKLLANKMLDVDYVYEGTTALYWAVHYNKVDLAKILLHKNAHCFPDLEETLNEIVGDKATHGPMKRLFGEGERKRQKLF